MTKPPIPVRVVRKGRWEAAILVNPIYGDAGGVATRLRSLGLKARVQKGEVVVTVSET